MGDPKENSEGFVLRMQLKANRKGGGGASREDSEGFLIRF